MTSSFPIRCGAAVPSPTLRERRHARTRLALRDALLRRLSTHPLSAVFVKELSLEAGICEATFFNYFRRKEELLDYFGRLFDLEIAARAQATGLANAGLGYIDFLFDFAGRCIEEQPGAFVEYFATRLRPMSSAEQTLDEVALTAAERWLAFPELREAWNLEEVSLTDQLSRALLRAEQLGELEIGTDHEATTLALVNTLFGIPLRLGSPELAQVRQQYRRQLQLLMGGLSPRPLAL